MFLSRERKKIHFFEQKYLAVKLCAMQSEAIVWSHYTAAH